MKMPSRIELRRWLVELRRDDILLLLDQIKKEHGEDNERDVRDLLNIERENKTVNSPAEASLVDMPETLRELESLKRLHKVAS